MSVFRRMTMLEDNEISDMEAAAYSVLEEIREAIALALARAWEEGAEAAFDAEYSGPLFGPALDEFYASNPYRRCVDAPSEKETPTP